MADKKDETYRKTFEAAKEHLKEALATKARADKEAADAEIFATQLRRIVVALAAMVGENVEDSIGLTEAVRMVIKTTLQDDKWYALGFFKAQVQMLGVSFDDLKNPDASLLSVLSRMVTAKELETQMLKTAPEPGKQAGEVRAWKKMSPEDVPLTDDEIPF